MNQDNDDKITCIDCGTRYDSTEEQCPKCGLANYRYGRSSDYGSQESEKEMNAVIKALDNPNRRKILKVLLKEGEKNIRELKEEMDISVEATTKQCEQLLSVGLISEEGRIHPERKHTYIRTFFINVEKLLEVSKKIPTNFLASRGTLSMNDYTEEISSFAKKMNKDIESHAWIIIDSCENDGKAFPLNRNAITIGRDTKDGIDISLPNDLYVSGTHAKIYQTDKREQKYILVDLKSRNHTMIHDRILVDDKEEIKNGDRFKIGKTWLKFIIPEIDK
jgi:DNA-binding transcriptional ArsR family regulator